MERNYYLLELEMKAVTWGCEKMNMYLQGLPHFIVQTDHKPLIPIINNKLLIDMSPRIQAMRLKQMKYSFTAEYVKRKTWMIPMLSQDRLQKNQPLGT